MSTEEIVPRLYTLTTDTYIRIRDITHEVSRELEEAGREERIYAWPAVGEKENETLVTMMPAVQEPILTSSDSDAGALTFLFTRLEGQKVALVIENQDSQTLCLIAFAYENKDVEINAGHIIKDAYIEKPYTVETIAMDDREALTDFLMQEIFNQLPVKDQVELEKAFDEEMDIHFPDSRSFTP